MTITVYHNKVSIQAMGFRVTIMANILSWVFFRLIGSGWSWLEANIWFFFGLAGISKSLFAWTRDVGKRVVVQYMQSFDKIDIQLVLEAAVLNFIFRHSCSPSLMLVMLCMYTWASNEGQFVI